MPAKILHQFSDTTVAGDAITDQAFLLQRWLRQWGFTSDIYAIHIDARLVDAVKPLASYTPQRDETHFIYHHSIGSDMVDVLATPKFTHLQQILIYHNITPPEFFDGLEPALVNKLQRGRAQLTQLQPNTRLALCDSPYNEAELQALNFTTTGVLPLPLDPSQYDHPFNHDLQAQFADKGPLLLFLGRIAPNKCQDDLLKLLHYYHRLRPDAQLIIVGNPWLAPYVHWVQEMVTYLDLNQSVHFPGHVSFADMVTYYQIADLYISMSAHEGLGKPLLESMYLGTPVLAYATTAVPSTVDTGGILFHQKNYAALAELVDMMIYDKDLNQRLITNGRARVQHFLPDNVQKTLNQALTSLNLLP